MPNAPVDHLKLLVSKHRARASSTTGRNLLVESESDKGRVVNSSAFRRLQQKAQVFPLDENAAVRTRLTHSIEVSQVGRYLAQSVLSILEWPTDDFEGRTAFANIVESACLLHDIGNPPFGHLGEAAVCEWFSAFGHCTDLLNFDGNPQGFRLISFLSGEDSHGMNLTSSLLLATVKYPWTHVTAPAALPNKAKKIGLYASDLAAYEAACNALGWAPGRKFPFMLLMEAADDIAYSISDIEDGLEKQIVNIDDIKQAFGAERFVSSSVNHMVAFKASVINEAVRTAAQTYANNIDKVISGEPLDIIPKNSEIGSLLSRVRTFTASNIYSSPEAERMELAGRQVIFGLLEHFRRVLEVSEADFLKLLDNEKDTSRRLAFESRLLHMIPSAYRKKYTCQDRGSEMDRRCHLIVDFISGMTDSYALETYQLLQGIRVR